MICKERAEVHTYDMGAGHMRGVFESHLHNLHIIRNVIYVSSLSARDDDSICPLRTET